MEKIGLFDLASLVFAGMILKTEATKIIPYRFSNLSEFNHTQLIGLLGECQRKSRQNRLHFYLFKRYAFSGARYLYTTPAKIAPIIGATQNNHNWPNAQSPTNKAWLVLRAGFTDVLVTGIEIK